MKDWEKYEQQIYDKFDNSYTDCVFTKNDKILGQFSGKYRQIDISARGTLAGIPQLLVIECKYFNKNVDIKIVESFISFLEDVNANHGVIITNCGFTDGAKNRVKGKTITLDVVNFKDFDEYIFEPEIYSCHMCDDKYRNVVHWNRYDVENSFDVGHCAYCNETHIRCKCGGITAVSETNQDGLVECLGGCGLKLKHSYDEYHDEHFDIIEHSSFK